MKKRCIIFALVSFLVAPLFAQWVDISEASAPVRGIYADTLNSRLYAVGQFRYIGPDSLEARGTAYWESTQWHEVPNAQVLGGSLSAVNSFLANIISDADGIIFSGFRVELSGGKSGAVIRYDGDTTLTVLVDSCSGGPCAWVTILDSELYVTGRFTSLNGSPLYKAVKWNGAFFEQVMDVDPVTFSAIEPIVLFNGELVAGGSVYDTVSTQFRGLMRHDGSQWNFLPGGIFGAGFGGVGEMAVYNNELWCGGGWFIANGNLAEYLQIWNGQGWRALAPEFVFTNSVYHLQVLDGEMYITGTFRIGGQGPEYHFARTDGQTYFCALGTAPGWTPYAVRKIG